MPPVALANQTPTTPPQVSSGTQRTMSRMPVGGLGAMLGRPDMNTPRMAKVPTMFYSAPAVSSLPYLNDDTKERSDESIVMLKIAFAEQKERQQFDYIYTDKHESLLESNIGNDIAHFTKYAEPSTEELMRKYLTGAIEARNAEKMAIETKRITGVDKSMRDFGDQLEQIKAKGVIEKSVTEAEKIARARRMYMEQLASRSGVSGKLSGLTEKEIETRLKQMRQGEIKTLGMEELEAPIYTAGIPTASTALKQALAQVANDPKRSAELDANIRATTGTQVSDVREVYSKMSKGKLAKEIGHAGLAEYTTGSHDDMVTLLTYNALSKDPRTRSALEYLNAPIPDTRPKLSTSQSALVDRVLAHRTKKEAEKVAQEQKRHQSLIQELSPADVLKLPAGIRESAMKKFVPSGASSMITGVSAPRPFVPRAGSVAESLAGTDPRSILRAELGGGAGRAPRSDIGQVRAGGRPPTFSEQAGQLTLDTFFRAGKGTGV